jgi:hypothetical protein
LSWSGATPLFPDFSFYKGWFVFLIQKNWFIYYGKEYFDTTFCFFIAFLRPLPIRAKVSYLFNHLFSFSFGLFLLLIFFFFYEALPRGTNGELSSSHATHAPRTDNRPLLRAKKNFFFQGKSFLRGDINSSS